MSDIVIQKNIGAYIDQKALFGSIANLTAGGAGNGVAVTSSSLDRQGFPTGSPPLSMDLGINWYAVLAAGKTLSLQVQLQTSPDNVNWTNYLSAASAIVATGPAGGGTLFGVYRLIVPSADNPANIPGVSLNSASRYVRAVVTPTLSATATDTAQVQDINAILGGFDSLPAPIN